MRAVRALATVIAIVLTSLNEAQVRTISRGEDGVPSFVEGPLARLPDTSETSIRAAAAAVARQLRVAPGELVTARVVRDAGGMTHVRLRQREHGLDVVGGDLVLHANRDGTVFAANGTLRDAMPAPEPRLDAARAAALAVALRGGEAGTPRLVYLIASTDRSRHLAWEVETRGEDFLDLIYVDAHDGAIADVHPQIRTAIRRAIYTGANAYTLPGLLRRSEGSGPVNDTAIDADYDHFGRVYNCFSQLFALDSFDDRGGTITSTVHYGFNYNNAFWNGSAFVFGSGDGVSRANFALSFDVTAHEFTHAVTQYTSALVYSGQPGALNEALSDIFGAVCESRNPGTGTNVWWIGETIVTPSTGGDALRYMEDPARDGASRDYYPDRFQGTGDNGGVHVNSGIANLAFYLLASGGTHPRGKTNVAVSGVGINTAAGVFMRANDLYLTSNATFADARAATIRAARDIGSQSLADTTGRAWDAVGVLDPNAPPPPVVTAPASPANLLAIPAAPGRIDLTWSDRSSNEDGFRLERRVGVQSYAEFDRVGANVTSYANSGLTGGATYFYRVRAYNTGGNSAYSNEAAAVVPTGGTIPTAPSSLSVITTTTSSVQLRWLDNSSNEGGFIVERGLTSNAVTEVARTAAGVAAYEDRNLSDNTTYLYRVRAYNGAGSSSPSNVVEAHTLIGGTAPNAPSNISARADSVSAVTVSWRDNSTNETGFYLERMRYGAEWTLLVILGTNVTSYTDTAAGLASAPSPGVTPPPRMVTYRVRACRGSLCSGYTEEVTISTNCRGSLSSYASVFGKNGGGGAYTVSALRGCKGGTTLMPGDATWVTLTQGAQFDGTTTIAFQVAPLASGERIAYLSSLTGHPLVTGFMIHEIKQTAVTIEAPVELHVTSLTPSSSLLEWSGGAGATSFTIERRSSCQASFEVIGSSDTSAYIDSNRDETVSYAYRVQGNTEGIESAYSNIDPPLGVSSSCGGGTESMPLFLWTGSALPVVEQTARGAQFRPPPMWQWQNRLSRRAGSDAEPSVAQYFPAALPGTTARSTVPHDVLGFSNATDSAGIDYVAASGRTAASIAAFRSPDSAYAHDYAVCGRFKEGRLTEVVPVPLAVPGSGTPVWFWRARMEYNGRDPEWAVTFAAYPRAGGFAVDAHWFSEQYRTEPGADVLTFQVWSNDAADTMTLVSAILEKLHQQGTMQYDNAREPVTTTFFAAAGRYDRGRVEVAIANTTESAKDIGFTTIYWTSEDGDSQRRHFYTQSVPPGTTTVELPLPDLLNGIVYIDDGRDFADKLFVSDGHWFGFDSGAAAHVEFDGLGCATPQTLTDGDRPVSGCGTMRGALDADGFAGFARGLNPPGRAAVDARQWQAVTFFARGDGKTYRMALETETAARAGAPYPRIRFTAPPEGRQFVVPLRAFRQPLGSSPEVPLTAADVRVLSWSAASAPLRSLDLSVEQIAFTNSVLIDGTTVLASTSAAGPYPITTHVTDDAIVQSVSLVYSVDGGAFTHLPMSASAEGDRYTAGLPAVARGASMRYYIEAIDDSGNVATDPFDGPAAPYTFSYFVTPDLVIDDFGDVAPENARQGEPFVFGTDSGSTIRSSYEDGRLQLTWDVRASGSFAGWFTPFPTLDASAFRALRFRIRGAAGGEHVRIGLRWGPASETKVLVGQHARIGTEWTEVTIPLAAFAFAGDRSHVEGIVVAFENGIASGAGSLELDDLRFTTLDADRLPVDNFDDGIAENACGGSLGVFTGNGAAGAGTHADGALVYSFEGVTATAWTTLAFDLGGVDLTRMTRLAFSVAGAAGGEHPHIYLVSGSGESERRAYVELAHYGTITRDWSTFALPLEDFDIDRRDVRRLFITFEWTPMNGAIRLDDLRFERGAAKRRTTRP